MGLPPGARLESPTSERTSPPLSCSTTVLHVERSEKVDTGLAERRLIGCDPCFRKRGHLLRQRGCVDPATTRAMPNNVRTMPNNVLGQSASIHDPKLASALGECLLPTSVRGPFVIVPHDQFADVVSLRKDRRVTFITRQSSSSGKVDLRHTGHQPRRTGHKLATLLLVLTGLPAVTAAHSSG